MRIKRFDEEDEEDMACVVPSLLPSEEALPELGTVINLPNYESFIPSECSSLLLYEREREGGTSNKRSTRVAIARYREREFKQTCPSLFCTYSRNSTLFNFVICKSIAAWGLSDLHSAKKMSMHQLENIHLKTTTTLNEDFKKKTEKQRENYIYVHMLLMIELLSKSRDAHSFIPSANFNLSARTVRPTDCITISSRKSSAKFTKQKKYYLKPPSKNPIQLFLSFSLSLSLSLSQHSTERNPDFQRGSSSPEPRKKKSHIIIEP